MPMDALFQQLSTVQSNVAPLLSQTIASAVTIAPQTFISFISGTVGLNTIVPPTTGSHLLVLIFTAAVPVVNVISGNIKNAVTPTQNVPVLAVYDQQSAAYYLK
jgi:hypothetical protein